MHWPFCLEMPSSWGLLARGWVHFRTCPATQSRPSPFISRGPASGSAGLCHSHFLFLESSNALPGDTMPAPLLPAASPSRTVINPQAYLGLVWLQHSMLSLANHNWFWIIDQQRWTFNFLYLLFLSFSYDICFLWGTIFHLKTKALNARPFSDLINSCFFLPVHIDSNVTPPGELSGNPN